MSIVRKIPWTSQPPAGVELDLTNPLTKHLVGAWTFNGNDGFVIDSLQNNHLHATGLNPPNLGPSPKGMAYKQRAIGAEASADHGRFATEADIAGNSPLGMADSNEMTIIHRAMSFNASSSPRIVDKGTGGNGAGGYAMYWSSTQAVLTVDGSNAILTGSGVVSTTDGNPYTVSCRYHETDSALRSMRVNGVEKLSSSFSLTFPTNTTPFSIGNWARTDTTSSRRFHGDIDYVFIFDKSLTDSEVISLEKNVWQLFQPRTQVIPNDIVAASVIVLTDVANSGETPGLGTETWADGSTGNVITGSGW